MTIAFNPLPHPVAEMAFWGTNASEITAMRVLYDELTGGDSDKVLKLQQLMQWAGEQRSLDDNYNNTDFNPD